MAKAYKCNVCQTVTQVRPSVCHNCGAASSKILFLEVLTKSDEERSKMSRNMRRFATCYSEINRIIGGELEAGWLIYLGGDPGGGKTTVSLTMGHEWSKSQRKVLYVCAEESWTQVSKKCSWLGITENAYFKTIETADAFSILERIAKDPPDIVFVDSINVIKYPFPGADETGGTPAQIKRFYRQLKELLIEFNILGILICQITKAGSIAGAKEAEHAADLILTLRGDERSVYRRVKVKKFKNAASIGKEGLLELAGDKGLIDARPKMELPEPKSGKTGMSYGFFLGDKDLKNLTLVDVQSKLLTSSSATRVAGTLKRAIILPRLESLSEFGVSLKGVIVESSGPQSPETQLASLGAVWCLLNQLPLSERILYLGELDLTGHIKPFKAQSWTADLNLARTFPDAVIMGNISQAFLMGLPVSKVEDVASMVAAIDVLAKSPRPQADEKPEQDAAEEPAKESEGAPDGDEVK